MSYRTDIAYSYDGSLEGLMTCVFEIFEKKERPSAVFSPNEAQTVLYEIREIYTDHTKARRVLSSIAEKLGEEAMYLVKMTYYSDAEEKEIKVLDFLRHVYSTGAKAVSQLSHPSVFPVHAAARITSNEAALYNEFVRFSEYSGLLVSVIEPKAFVLPLIIDHFRDRLPSESFLIYDKTHKYALLYNKSRHEIAPMDSLELPQTDDEEQKYAALWQMFYNTIAVEGRTNHICRMNHMPKRFWSHMTEFQQDSPKLTSPAKLSSLDKPDSIYLPGEK